MPKASEKWAEEAMNYARSQLTLGSTNKKATSVGGTNKRGMDRAQRYEQASEALAALDVLMQTELPPVRNTWFPRGTYGFDTEEEYKAAGAGFGAAKVDLIATSAAKLQAGNCTEMSAIAYKYLFDQDVRPLYWLALEDPGDHVLVALGDLGGGDVYEIDTWGDEMFICDPWAKIACKAKEYKNEWLKKMQHWEDKKDEKGSPNAKEIYSKKKNKFVSPLSDDWKLAIRKHEFVVYASAK